MATNVTRVEMYIPISYFDSDFNEINISFLVNPWSQTLNQFTFDDFVQFTQGYVFWNRTTVPYPGRPMNVACVNILSGQRTALNAAFTNFVATLDASIQPLCFFVAWNSASGT